MKCPNCNFVTSNTNDLCSRCGMDLRPRKRELGITITNPAADIKALRARLAVQPVKKEESDSGSERPGQEKSKDTPREKSWLSRLFGKTATAAPPAPAPLPAATQPKSQLTEATNAAPAGGLNSISQKQPESQSAAAAVKSSAKKPTAPGQPAAIEMELSLSDLAIPQTSPQTPAEDPDQSAPAAEILGDEIQPDLSLNDFLSELERFQAVASDDLEETELPAAAEAGDEEAIDAELELPVFDLEDAHDLLRDSLFGGSDQSLPPPAALNAAAPSGTVEDSAGEDLGLFAAAAPAENSTGQLSVETAHEMAFDNLIGSMISPKADLAREAEESDDDALFASLLEPDPDTDSDSRDKLGELAQSLEDNLEDAMSATADLADSTLFGGTADDSNEDLGEEFGPDGGESDLEQTGLEQDSVPMETASPDVTPDVMEFDDDDKILEQQLDEMLGDLVLDVTPVKRAKPVKNEEDEEEEEEEDDDLVFIDDDIEISFDIEDDDGEDSEDQASAAKSKSTAAKDSGRSDQILDQLVEAFNQIDSGTVHHSIADTPDEPAPAAQPIKIDTMLLRLRAAAQFGSPNLIDELLEQLAQGYGVDSDLLREAVAPARQVPAQETAIEFKPPAPQPPAAQSPVAAGPSGQPAIPPVSPPISGESDFSELSTELDLELAALMSEGTSIFGEAPAEAAAEETVPLAVPELDPQLEPLAAGPAAGEIKDFAAAEPAIDVELKELQDALDSELVLLAAEGTTLIHQPAAEIEEPAPFLPTQTGAFLIGDLTALAGEAPAAEEAAPESEIADLEAELAQELAGLQQDGVSLYSLPETAEPVSAEPATAEPAPFTPTQTGAFLISDLTALVSEAPAAEPEPVNFDQTFNAELDISDLAAELDQELALLEAEGLSPARAEHSEPADAIKAEPLASITAEVLEELGDLEEFEEQALLIAGAAELGGDDILPDAALLHDVSLDAIESEIEDKKKDDEPGPSDGNGTPALESEIESSPTATGVFLASDLETILNSYNKPPVEKRADPADEPLLDEIALEDLDPDLNQAAAAAPAEIAVEEPAPAGSEASASQLAEIAGGSDPGDSAGQDPVPFDPEEVSIEPAEESAVNFSQNKPEVQNISDPAAAAEITATPEIPTENLSEQTAAEASALVAVRSIPDISAELWEAALTEAGADQIDIEIDAAEMCDSGPNPKLTLLFDLADEELESPEKKAAYVHAAPTSVSRALIDAGLKRAVKRYETEIHSGIARKPIDSGSDAQSDASVDELLKIHSPAPLWRRCASLTFDLLSSTSVAAAIVWFTLADEQVRNQLLALEVPAGVDALPAIIAAAGISWILWTIFNVLPTTESGQTTGQKLLGIAVFDLEGNIPGFGQVFTRTMLELTTLMTLGLGVLPGLGRRKQMLHDRLARTVVVRLVQ